MSYMSNMAKSSGAQPGNTNRLRHGHATARSRTYQVWLSMRRRCTDPKARGFKDYGARGITVCERWNDFANFLADMGEAPIGKTLDREKNHVGYEPGNCVWSTPAIQNRNKRSNINLTIGDETLCLKDWCTRLGLNYYTVHKRIQRGATPLSAVTRGPP